MTDLPAGAVRAAGAPDEPAPEPAPHTPSPGASRRRRPFMPMSFALLAAVASGLISDLAFPDIGVWPLIFPGVALMLLALIGRSVWKDESGDQVFSELKGEGTAAKNRITGTILGGTGRYAGATGTYEFSWQFVLEAEDGSIQGSAVGLKGRVRPGQPTAEGARP